MQIEKIVIILFSSLPKSTFTNKFIGKGNACYLPRRNLTEVILKGSNQYHTLYLLVAYLEFLKIIRRNYFFPFKFTATELVFLLQVETQYKTDRI